jgi:HD domain
VRASVVEITGVLSLATDVTLGCSYEHGLRRAVLAVGLAEAVGADAAAIEEAYFVSLLMYIGCTAETSVTAALFGDDLAVGAAVAAHAWGGPRELARAAMPWLGSGQSGWRRVTAVARVLPVMKEQMTMHSAGHCEVAQMLARRLCLPNDYTTAFRAVFERWDGKGHPGTLRGDEIPLSVRIAQVADDFDLQISTQSDPAACMRTIVAHGGAALDPDLVRAFADCAESLTARLEDGSAWAAAIGGRAPTGEPLAGRELDTTLEAIADFADMKATCFLGRSRAVAGLAAAAADALGSIVLRFVAPVSSRTWGESPCRRSSGSARSRCSAMIGSGSGCTPTRPSGSSAVRRALRRSRGLLPSTTSDSTARGITAA